MNKANTVMVAIFVALATTTGLVTALSMISQQTAFAVFENTHRQGTGGGCGKSACGGEFSAGTPTGTPSGYGFGGSIRSGNQGCGGGGSGIGGEHGGC
jgi:hypothetical protein